MTHPLTAHVSPAGRLEPVWAIEIQTVPEDVDRILDAIVEVEPLRYGRYGRNASVSGLGLETARPLPDSTTAEHQEGFETGDTETYPMVALTVSIPRETDVLRSVLDAVLEVHHYEEPVIFVSETWASRANYDPKSSNPHRWWNNGRGLPDRIDDIATALGRT